MTAIVVLPEFVLFSDNPTEVAMVSEIAARIPNFSARPKPKGSLNQALRADAIFVPLPYAERWGATPHGRVAQVFRTTEQDKQAGLPNFVIAAGTYGPDDVQQDPEQDLRLLMEFALAGAKSIQRIVGEHVRLRIASTPKHLGLSGITPSNAVPIILEVFDRASSADTSDAGP